jgi:hypothetical protein
MKKIPPKKLKLHILPLNPFGKGLGGIFDLKKELNSIGKIFKFFI